MPLIDERLDVLHDAGKTLLKKYDGSFVNVVLQCDKSAQKLLQLVVQEFPSYRYTYCCLSLNIFILHRLRNKFLQLILISLDSAVVVVVVVVVSVVGIGGFFFFNPLPDDKILDWSKLKQIADDISKCI